MQIEYPKVLKRWLSQPIDRVATTLLVALGLVIGVVLWGGDRTTARVRDFSWQNTQVGAEDSAFILTFNRPMDQSSVEANLRLAPDLPGKISWAGRRMAYTLLEPAPYGSTFQVRLEGAQDRFANTQKNRRSMQPFVGKFRSRDRAFAYLGVEGAEAGRLILYNLTTQKKIVLTPSHLMVSEFKAYPDGDRLLFAATDRAANAQGLFDAKLYTVSTGIQVKTPGNSQQRHEPAGTAHLVLDNQAYQNLKFDLAPDGHAIIVQRAERKNPGNTALWLVEADSPPKLLGSETGGDFLITPDSTSVIIAQGQGLAILPIDAQASAQPLDFLPKFGMVLSFARDGSEAAMVKFNTDYTRSLYRVTNTGIQQEILKTTGSILSAQFDPLKQKLYCLLTQLVPGPDYKEQPYLAVIDLKTAKLTPLVLLPIQRDLHMSLSPDGVALLFDQAVNANQPTKETLQTDQGVAIATSKLWLLPVLDLGDAEAPAPKPGSKPTLKTVPQPEALPLPGFKPQWLP